jgi:hypothetical protein
MLEQYERATWDSIAAVEGLGASAASRWGAQG